MLPGQTISHYRILERLGEGGMGEVFLAEDTSLDRRVALKVLSPALAADPARRERFVREAKAVAALSHPNIVTVYSVEQAGEAHFLTMELVDGKTLADLIPPAGLPIDRLLDLAIPLADAIAAAHERGITHRDLKPANVMVTGGGRVKVLDFGLAKLSAPGGALGSAETMAGGASALTGEGKIVGTVAYMSPEQAEGRNVDHRTDIFAFGVLLYEMATGVRPFTGDTSLSVLSAIMKDTPKPASELNPRVPRELGKIIRRCLQKDPEQRFQNAKDIRNELQELQRDLASGELDAPMASAPAAAVVSRRRAAGPGLILAIAGVAVLAAGAGLWLWSGGRGPTAPADVRFTQLTFQAGTEGWPSLSPDGRWVVYAAAPTGNFDVLLQSVGGQTTINLTKDSPSSDSQPAFSPDGEEIAFRSARQGGGIFVMRRTGEFVRRVTDNGFNPTWSPDGTQLAYVTESTVNPYGRVAVSELWTVTVATGEKRRLPAEDAMEPHWSPDGRHIAYWGLPPGTSRRDIFTIPVDGGAPIAVTDDEPLDASPAWTPDGSAIYFASDRGGSLNLWRIPVDASGRRAGDPVAVTAPAQFVQRLSLSVDGTRIAFASLSTTSNIRRIGFAPETGAVDGEGQWVTGGFRFLTDLHVSPDGTRLAYRAGITQEDLFVSNIDGTREQQLTSDPANDRYPRWSPDGTQIVFYSDRSGSYELWSIAPDGGRLHQLTAVADGAALGYPTWSPDGTRIAGTDLREFIVTLFDPRVAWAGQAPERLLIPSEMRFAAWSWSPDGTKLAGRSRQGIGVYELGARAFRVVPGTPSGVPATWLPDSRRLLYSQGGTVKIVDVASGAIADLFTTSPDQIRNLTISADGRQIFVAQGGNEADIWMATIR